MFDTDQKLRHLSFFEAVAELEAESAEWRAATAGLVTLRLIDSWLDGDLSLKEDHWSVPRVRTEILAMDETSTQRTMLLRVVDAIRSKKPDIRAVISQLMAYGQALEYEGRWLLAGDVYQTLLVHLHPIEDSEASIAAHLRRGMCFRHRHFIAEAATEYAAAADIAAVVGDLDGTLRARIAEASLAQLRGNLPAAASMLDDAVAQAVGPDFAEVRAKALMERSSVAILSGQYELGIRIAYSALVQSLSSTDRDRTLNNIAGAFVHLGVYSAARDAYLVLSATAQEQYIRWTATLNLLDVASLTGSEAQFESYRRQMSGVQLVPQLKTAFELTLGQGYRRLGDPIKSQNHLNRALALAGEHNLNQFLIEAEAAIEELTKKTPPQAVESSPSLDVAEVALAIREMREELGVG